jgi:hypothetical protein
VPSDHSDGPSEWDQEEAEGFVGLMALVGVTYLAADGKTVKSQAQYYGRVVSVDQIKGIVIACEGRWAGSIMTLPPALRSFQYARPGQYKLHSTGETVENPDLTTFFSVTEPSKS